MKLQLAMKLLADIFQSRPEGIEGIIQSRLAERTCREEHECGRADSCKGAEGRLAL